MYTYESITDIKIIITPITPEVLFLKNYFIYLFLERGEGKEEERERNINVWLPLARPQMGTWPATQACALTGDPTGDLSVHRLVFNPLSRTSQGDERFYEQF